MIRTLQIVVLALALGACERPASKTSAEAVQGARASATSDNVVEVSAKVGAEAATESKRDPAQAPTIVVADLHGDIEPLRELLAATGLAKGGEWTGGARTLVQTGDVLDRGDDEREIYELLWSLRDQATKAGGEVVLLNGNHEVMNVMGDLRYVTPGGAADYSEYTLPDDPRFARVPDDMRGRLAAFLPGGPWANKLASQPVIARVDGRLFAHGGVHLSHVEYGIEAINDEMRKWMQEGGAPPKWATAQDGPLWTRAWSGSETPDCDRLEKMLETANATMLAVGHTPQRSGVQARCDGKLWLIDTGMAEHYGGPTQAIGIFEDSEVGVVDTRNLQ